MKNKWASCSTNGYLNFNRELLDLDKELGEYVIVHEIVHLYERHHNDNFKMYMDKFMPQWRLHRDTLNKSEKVSAQI